MAEAASIQGAGVTTAVVVMHMNRRLPLEGGLYEWARIAFGDQVGFLAAWNLWMYGIVYVGLAGLLTASFVSYAFPGWGWIASNKAALAAFSVAVVGMTMLVASVGLARNDDGLSSTARGVAVADAVQRERVFEDDVWRAHGI